MKTSIINYDYAFFKNLIHTGLLNLINENYSFYSENSEEKLSKLSDMINSQIYLDTKFKATFENELYCLVSDIVSESFDKGIEIAFSFIKSIMTAEPNTLEVRVKEPNQTPKAETSGTAKFNPDDEFSNFLNRAVPMLSEENKAKLQSRIEVLIEYQNRIII